MEKNPNKYLLDTTVLIDFLRACFPEPRSIYHQTISVGSVFEIWMGMKIHERDEHIKLVSSLNVVPISKEIAMRAGELAEYFNRKKDKSISSVDFFIAATAEECKLNILTRNPKHFEKLQLNGINVVTYQLQK